MRLCSVGTEKYNVDLRQLLKRRMERLNGFIEITGEQPEKACASLYGEEELLEWCKAVARLILYDLAQFEIASMVNRLPISLEEKKAVLPEAVMLSRQKCDILGVENRLEQYFSKEDHLELEGFIAFRMKEQLLQWERCILSAADELVINAEYMELMRVLAAFIQLRAPRSRDVCVILNPDGSCTFTDDDEVRIDYEKCTDDGIMSVLVGLAPKRITVYDLSGGKSRDIAQNLIRVFDGRVKFFK